MTEASTSPTPLLSEWAAELTTRTGLKLYVRPANPEDRGALDRFFGNLATDDLRFRFLSPLHRPSASLLDALTDVDHVRTEDFLVFTDLGGRKEIIASAMLAADEDMSRAEVAIAVRPEFKQRGVGWTLLDFVARDAAARGIGALESIECRDNRVAIALETEMGFTTRPHPQDPTLTLVRKSLKGWPSAARA